MRRVDNYLISYMIMASTQSDNRDFIDSLIETQRFMQGFDPNPQLDREALNAWKQEIADNSNLIKTKV